MTTGAGSVCALDTTGQAYCWGRGFNDLGSSFQSLSSKLQTNLRFNSIAAGFAHNCGLSLNNAIFCWGNNKDGQIGDYSAVAVPPSLYGKTVVVLPTLIAAP
jgi:alpha-tubulin suppressor-like RCC1 family protein